APSVDDAAPGAALAAPRLGAEDVAVVAARALPLPPRPSMADLSQLSWVLNPEGCGFRAVVRQRLEATRLPFEIAGEALTPELQLSLVARGVGVGMVTASVLAASRHRKQLRVVDVKDFRIRVSYWLVRRSALGRLQQPVEVFRDALIDALPGESDRRGSRARPRARRA